MEKTYAQVLWTMVSRGTEPKRAVRVLKELLEREGRAQLIPRVARAFARIAQRESKKQSVVLAVARESDSAHAKRQAHDDIARLGLAAHDVGVSIDESLIGGWRLEGKETLVDASYKRRLLDLYSRVTRE